MRFLRSLYGSTLATRTRFLQVLFLLLYSPVLVQGAAGRSIEETEAWRVALFFVLFFLLSILLETFLHNLEHYLEHIEEFGILEAVRKFKDEFMLLGFISLLLIIFEDSIVKMCLPMPSKIREQDSIPCCNTQPRPSIQTQIEDTLKACIENYTSISDGRKFVEKGNIRDVQRCNDNAVTAWRIGGEVSPGYVPLPTSELLSVCPAPGQDENAKLISDRHEFECPLTADGDATASFISINAMHQLHTLIFVTAVCHIGYSAMIMFISQTRVRNWTRWETYGDDEDETVDKLHTPTEYPNCFVAIFVNCFHQCFKAVDPLTYIAVRRYYIIRNNLSKDFNFNQQLMECHRKDFRDLVGISSWMWIIIIVLVLADGYIPSDVRGLKMINTYVALITCLLVGTKLLFVFKNVVSGVLKKLDIDHAKGGSRAVTEEELETLQDGPIIDSNIFDDVDADFWCHHWCCGKKKKCLGDNAPKLMLNLIRLVMFQNSYTVAQLVFYLTIPAQPFDETCFYKARAWYIFVFQLVCVVAMFVLNGLVTVPLYSICAITTHHKTYVDLHKHFKTVHHTLQDELKIIQQTLAEGAPPTPHSHEATPVSPLGEEPEPEPEPPQKKSPVLSMTSFMFHAKEAMLKKRLATTQRQLEAMRTMRMHSMRQGNSEQELETEIAEREQMKAVRNSQVVPENSASEAKEHSTDAGAKKKTKRRKSHLLSKKAVSTISTAVQAIAGFPVVRTFVAAVLLVAIVLGAMVTPQWYMTDYGYFVPHWTYQGWGGPIYWSRLTKNEDNHMQTYNNIEERRDEWTVPEEGNPNRSKYVYEDLFSTEHCIPKQECVSYSKCKDGDYQSPININLVSWKEDAQNTDSQFQYSKKENGDRDYKTLRGLFESDPEMKFIPVYYHEQLKFYCHSTSEKNTNGVFEWSGTKYKLDYMKIHTPAEHTFDNMKHGMEMQFIMKSPKDEKTKEKKTLALAVLFDVGVKSSKSITAIDNIFGNSNINMRTGRTVYENLGHANENMIIYKKHKLKKKEKMKLTEKVNLDNIIHKDSSFFMYEGSDTSPPCKEGVKWFIQSDIVHMTENQWQGIYDFFGYPGNARPPQDVQLNPSRRVIYYGPEVPKTITGLGVDW